MYIFSVFLGSFSVYIVYLDNTVIIFFSYRLIRETLSVQLTMDRPNGDDHVSENFKLGYISVIPLYSEEETHAVGRGQCRGF